MQVVRNRNLGAWLDGAIDGSQDIIDDLVNKLTEARGKMGFLSSHLAWSENAITAAGRGEMYTQYKRSLVKGLEVHNPQTDAEFHAFYTLMKDQAVRELVNSTGNGSNNTMATINLVQRAKLTALAAIIDAVDWVLMEYQVDIEKVT